MQYKPNVLMDVYRKRPNGKIYRDVRFKVKGATICIEELLVASDDAAYVKAKQYLKQAMEL